MELYLGIDFGTSGIRAAVIDSRGTLLTLVSDRFQTVPPDTLAIHWREGLFALFDRIPIELRQQIGAMAIDGTSSTVLLCDGEGEPVDAPILYNDDRGAEMLPQLRDIAPPDHTVISATSSLAKLLWWSQQPCFGDAQFLMHQADWLTFLLQGKPGISDYHNSLKLGYDVEQLRYPNWLTALPVAHLLPQVMPPGTAIAPILPALVQRFGFPANCQVCTGTTDSIAAFLASGAQLPGEAVTSLGSTLVLKLLSHQRIEVGRLGIYSHRLGDLWLVGGASNTGGTVLQQFFTSDELARLSAQIPVDRESPLDYYPLPKAGERFPINDPTYPPRLEPRPTDPVEFLHGLLQGIARIEAQGYQSLQDLGADILRKVYTAGGGSHNTAWMGIRSRYLGVPVVRSTQTEAAYGTARLAMGCLN